VGGVKGVMRAAAAAGAIALTTHTLAALIEGEDPAELAMRALQGVVQYAGEVGSDFGWAARLGGGIYNPLGAAGFGAAYVFLKHVVVGGIVGIPTSFAGAISGSFRLGKAIGKHLRDALLEPPNLGPPAKLAANLDPEFIPQPTAVDIPPIGYEKAFGPPATPGGPVAVGIPLLDTAGDNNPATERERYEEEVARRAQQLDKQLAALERARYEADVASRATDLERRLSEAERQARIRAAQAEYNRQIEAYNRALQNYQNWSRQQQWIQFQQRMQQQQQWRPPQWNQPQPWHNHGVPRQPTPYVRIPPLLA
jgi:hypothetical protein